MTSGKGEAPDLLGAHVSIAGGTQNAPARAQAATAPDPWTLGFALVERSTQHVVGSCAFKGPADADGIVEIAYGVVDEQRGKGYATEAAEAMVAFAFGHAHVRLVRAHTLSDESASARVLAKCAFRLIGMVDDGILIDGRGSYSIDQQRYNFQFGGDAFWEIKNGKKGRMLADVAYQSRTQDFWNACAAIADQRHWENVGLRNDGKGQPSQVNAIMGFGMGIVLQPIFAQMSQDLSRQSAAFLRACRVLATITIPVCLLQAVLAPAAFRLVLPETWSGAVALAQILSVGQAFFFAINPAIGLLTAQGRFGTYMLWQTIQLVVVVTGMIAAGASSRAAPLVPIVLVGGLYHVVSAPVGVRLAVRGAGVPLWRSLDVFLRPLALAIGCILPVAWGASQIPPPLGGDLLALVTVPVLSLGAFAFLVRRFDPAVATDFGMLARRIRDRLRSPQP